MDNLTLIKQNRSKAKYAILGISLALFGLQSCQKVYDLPDEQEFLSPNINYPNQVFEPIIGRTTELGSPNTDNSTKPLTFEIVNARYGDGRPVTDIFQVRPTYVWTGEYTGLETTLEEIEAKRKIEERPMFEVLESGKFVLWGSSSNDLIEPRPTDSSNLVQDRRYFDLKISNVGGETIIKDFQLIPWRELPYEPNNDIDPYTGGVARDPKDPRNPNKRDYILPSNFDNIIGAQSNLNLANNDKQKDIVVYIRPFEGGNGHNLRFAFMGPDSTLIDPAKFNETRWDELVHGFNRVNTSEYVQYDVAYPIPLTTVTTDYASGGSAHVEFSYYRLGFNSVRTTAHLGFNFKIFREGDWEVVFHFRRELPKFEDEY
ncbi:DUF5007 domain-containing protein [Olivibacter ginsenosidimutans]|uniref:DUF5007 domain-containing protein n=1 Tax=Olivibacter ginsenosidimutans TaxID=1176537 RepID=A0ABP9CDS2_9SPHI